MEARLERTGQAPLDIEIVMDMDGYDSDDAPDTEEIWEDEPWTLLSAQSHRWASLSVTDLPCEGFDALSKRRRHSSYALSSMIDSSRSLGT
ncbi:hypothetical protein BD626DRAFT_483897 [Schizophyllum amplum]|uniref:Uncharacterized protein n=1 Tax=Schizophyllum amplum TaxID=97359 RepID=A0A550CPV5_9AGAR|nr:hypothetical protein BD626DRAFT_483897 [Auriculariopsis ampla]